MIIPDHIKNLINGHEKDLLNSLVIKMYNNSRRQNLKK